VLNSDDARYAGSGVLNGDSIDSEDIPWHGRSASIRLTLPPLGGAVLLPAAVAGSGGGA